MKTLNKVSKITFLLMGLMLLAPSISYGQYFGRNKPKYKKIDFEVVQSPHFEMYHYCENDTALKNITQQFENWYQLHQAVLLDTFSHKNPIILYNNHADFQQTTAISGSIGVGTGGVTEAFKNRVVMPFMEANAQTDHVAGHELVHAFQYHIILNGDSTSLQNLRNLPLWLVEGMAEYLSIGRVDAHTAMWMRDAVLNDDIPTIKDLNNNPKYFPYRYGQAFWAYLTGKYGDAVVRPFFEVTAKEGLEVAIMKVLGTNQKDLSADWQQALRNHYSQWLTGKTEQLIGQPLLNEDGGKMMIAPSVSPNGKYVIFLSEKNLLSLDLFLADTKTGKIIRKVASSTKDSHIDDFSYLESAGTWSPNSKRFAYVVFSKGINKLVVKEAHTGKTQEELAIPGVPAFSNPAWSPRGNNIVVTGLVNGQSDLYLFNLNTKKVTQLTNDRYSDIQAQWSADGKKIVFATDRIAMTKGGTNGEWTFNIAVLDVETGIVQNIDVFRGADNLNPVFAENNEEIIFLSDQDGFRNMYRYNLSTRGLYQMSNFLTGVSGITKFSPAISVARQTGRVIYTHYSKNQYAIYNAHPTDFALQSVNGDNISKAAAVVLPVINTETQQVVNKNLANRHRLESLSDTALTSVPYRPKFKLDYATGGGGVAMGANGFGQQAGLAGGVSLLFGDMLGEHQLFSTLALNGEVIDAGGQLTYVNQKNRIGWGASIGHIPTRFGNWTYAGIDTIYSGGEPFLADKVILDVYRMFQDRADVFAQFAFSQAQRFEVGLSGTRYSYRHDADHIYYNAFGQPIYQERVRNIDDMPSAFFLGNLNAAYVGDNAQSGIASPLNGYRFRIGAEQYMGAANFTQLTVDLRAYKYLKPVSLAARFTHFGRYGGDANFINPLYVGNSFFVRGYDFGRAGQQEDFAKQGWSFDQLLGSKMAFASAELRLPFTGPKRLSLIPSKYLWSELALFVDSGVAWSEVSDFENGDGIRPLPLLSAGISARINLFGAMVIEPFYAQPLQKGVRGTFGVNFIPGW